MSPKDFVILTFVLVIFLLIGWAFKGIVLSIAVLLVFISIGRNVGETIYKRYVINHPRNSIAAICIWCLFTALCVKYLIIKLNLNMIFSVIYYLASFHVAIIHYGLDIFIQKDNIQNDSEKNKHLATVKKSCILSYSTFCIILLIINFN